MLSGAPLNRKVDFARHVEPILKSSCYECHSGSRPKSGFDLDAKNAAIKGGIGGAVSKPVTATRAGWCSG